MVTGIEIRINDKATPALERFMNKQVGKIISKEVAHQLVEQMKSMVPFWNWNLYNSIQSRPTKNGYNISMLFYGRFVETGHKIKSMNPLLTHWAFAKIANPTAFFRMIYYSHRMGMDYQAKAHPFIQPSIDYVVSNLEPISVNIVNKTLKESGFK